MQRRSFLRTLGATVIAAAAGTRRRPDAQAADEVVQGLPRRALGHTGAMISTVGFPGLSLSNYSQDEGTAKIHEVFQQGLNYFDVAPAYGQDGACEIRMGIGLQGLDRDKIFLSCKTMQRDRAGAKEELDRSLKRLKTDHFDLYQLHCLFEQEEVEQALDRREGAIATILDAQKAGVIRYIGFSAHTTRAALEALNSFEFDTVMFPINFVEQNTIGMGRQVLELAGKRSAGVIAIKPISAGAWPPGERPQGAWWYRWPDDQEQLSLLLRWVLSQEHVAAGIPCSFFPPLDRCIQAARAFTPIRDEETERLRTITTDCRSLFRPREQSVSIGRRHRELIGGDNPHEALVCARHGHGAQG